MALKYHLVRRPDMRKDAPEGAQLVYGQVRAGDPLTFTELCEYISDECTASAADVYCVIGGLIKVLKKVLPKGVVAQVGPLGNFRMNASSLGVENEADFNTSLFKAGKVIFSPGPVLRDLKGSLKFEKLNVVVKEEECARPHVG